MKCVYIEQGVCIDMHGVDLHLAVTCVHIQESIEDYEMCVCGVDEHNAVLQGSRI